MPHAGHGRSTVAGAHGTTTPRNQLRAIGVCAFVLLLLRSAARARRSAERQQARPADRSARAAALRRRDRAGVRSLEGRARPRGRAVRHACRVRRDDQAGAADRRRPRQLRGEPGEVPGGHPGQRRPRPQPDQPQRHDELSLGALGRGVGDARQVRADVRDPPRERLHGAVADPRAERRGGHQPGREDGHAHARRQGAVPVSEGTDPDRRRRPPSRTRRSATRARR